MIQIKTSTPFAGVIDSKTGGRSENQDTCGYADTPLGLLIVVCDGMGGGPGGKLASSIAVDIIIQTIGDQKPSTSRQEALQNAIKLANHTLHQQIREKPALKGMGTTVSALLINDYSAIIAHAGDSRIYQFRRGHKRYRTFDHSMVFDLVKNGTLTEEQARLSSQSNVITRALGIHADLEAEIVELPYEKGDRFMLCTDGVWGVLEEKELIARAAKTKSLGGAVESLVIRIDELGFSNGGDHDNLTVALLQTTSDSILKEKMSTKIRKLIWGLSIICCLSIIGNILQFSRTGKRVEITDNAMQEAKQDSVLNVRFAEERERYEQKYKQLMETVSQLIKENKPDEANALLEADRDRKEVISKLDTIIKKLEALRNKEKGKGKVAMIQEVVSELKGMNPDLEKYGVEKKDLIYKNQDDVVALLNHSIAKESPRNDKSIGHYNCIISVLKSVKNKINNSL